jgi:tRNA/rRNA methyltransferase
MTGAGTDRTRPLLSGGPAVVLVRPQLAVNIGMCARAMANFGLDDLRLVNPKSGWPRTDEYREVAYNAAAGAAHILDAAKVFGSTKDALADLHFVYAATARERGQAKPIFTPAAAMPEAAGLPEQKRCIMFGPERTGLDNDEVALADAVLTFPTNPAYGSLNLAQAVLLVGYEWFKAAHGDAPPASAAQKAPALPATRETTIAFFEYLEEKLEDAGFFKPEGKRPLMQRNLRNIFHRLAMTEQDVSTLFGAVVRLVEGPRENIQTRKRNRAAKTQP